MVRLKWLLAVAVVFCLAEGSVFAQHHWPIPGDATLDCMVNSDDVIFVQSRYNQDPSVGDNWQADLNEDGMISVADLAIILDNFGKQCAATPSSTVTHL